MPAYLLHQLLEQSAQRTPYAPALSWQGRVYSYQHIESAANGLAQQLLQQGIKKGDRIALLLEKSPEAVVSIYGILKTGAAYVPLDSRSPIKRLGYIVRDCAISGLITTAQKLLPLKQDESFGKFSQEQDLVIIDEVDKWLASDESYSAPIIPDIMADDLAYILYTSGSTGFPKGVMLSHRAGMGFVNWSVDYFKIATNDKISSHAPFHFDLSVFDLFASAAAGACVCLLPPAMTLFPRNVTAWLAKERISIWYSAPTALTQLLLQGGLKQVGLPDLRHVLFAGEVFPVKYLKRWQEIMPQAAYHNLYGPTETNVCTVYSVPPCLDDDGPLPIGKACAGLNVFALTGDQRPGLPH